MLTSSRFALISTGIHVLGLVGLAMARPSPKWHSEPKIITVEIQAKPISMDVVKRPPLPAPPHTDGNGTEGVALPPQRPIDAVEALEPTKEVASPKKSDPAFPLEAMAAKPPEAPAAAPAPTPAPTPAANAQSPSPSARPALGDTANGGSRGGAAAGLSNGRTGGGGGGNVLGGYGDSQSGSEDTGGSGPGGGGSGIGGIGTGTGFGGVPGGYPGGIGTGGIAGLFGNGWSPTGAGSDIGKIKPISPEAQPDAGVPSCQTPEGVTGTMCNGVCIDTLKDLKNCGACGKACRDKQKCQVGSCTGGGNRQFVVDHVYLPHNPTEYAINLDNYGTVDNQFYHFIAEIDPVTKAGGFSIEGNLNTVITAGLTIMLFDAPPPEAQGEPVALFQGLGTANPDFSGMGAFQVDLTETPARYIGGVRQKDSFEYFTPPGAYPPILKLVIRSTGGPEFVIFLRCHHMHIDFVDDTHLHGELQGSILLKDLQFGFAGQVANYMNYEITGNPNYPAIQKKLLLSLFDNAGCNGCDKCKNPDGTQGLAGDGKISPCEILDNPIFKPMLKTDLHVWTDKGLFFPLQPPDDKKNDSLSFGLGFTAVGANIQ